MMLLLSALSAGCSHAVDLSAPIPTLTIPPRRATAAPVLIILLPGRGDNLEVLVNSGIGAAIQDAIPEAEVELVGATMPYYRKGFVERLDSEIVAPARREGLREIWMAGISLGGMGTILYEHDHPGELTGLVLLSPYLGERYFVAKVAAAGGPRSWQPDAGIAQGDDIVVPNWEWETVKRWSRNPAQAARVWFSCGTTDRFLPAATLIEPFLIADQVFSPKGGHNWGVWLPVSRAIFRSIEAHRREATHPPVNAVEASVGL